MNGEVVAKLLAAGQTTEHALSATEWPALPTETEIYILPTGEVVVADLPAELADLVAQLAVQRSDLGSRSDE